MSSFAATLLAWIDAFCGRARSTKTPAGRRMGRTAWAREAAPGETDKQPAYQDGESIVSEWRTEDLRKARMIACGSADLSLFGVDKQRSQTDGTKRTATNQEARTAIRQRQKWKMCIPAANSVQTRSVQSPPWLPASGQHRERESRIRKCRGLFLFVPLRPDASSWRRSYSWHRRRARPSAMISAPSEMRCRSILTIVHHRNDDGECQRDRNGDDGAGPRTELKTLTPG